MVTQSKSEKKLVFDRPGNYRICAHGSLDEAWSKSQINHKTKGGGKHEH